MRTHTYLTAILAVPLALAGCTTMSDGAAAGQASARAQANLMLANGAMVGTVTAMDRNGSVQIIVRVSGMPAGVHGVHVHMTGACEAPAFTSAGGHWNPTMQMHGLAGTPGQHAGDMPNLVVGADGTGQLQYTLVGGSFAQMMDADGAAFVVHAGPDDQMTDPSGNSGARLACGVFTAG